MDNNLDNLGKKVGEILLKKSFVLSTAESCTGGGIAEVVTRTPGSSEWFDRAFITYSNQAKISLVGVKKETLEKHGAVSQEVVKEMVENTLQKSGSSIVTAVSGIAGPTGGSLEKPVGTVFIGWGANSGNRQGKVEVLRCSFSGDRLLVRAKTIARALEGVIDWCS